MNFWTRSYFLSCLLVLSAVVAREQNLLTRSLEQRIYEDYRQSLEQVEFEEFLIKSKSDQSI